jgi:hypothetical protein
VDAACAGIGRDAAEIIRSVAQPTVVAADDATLRRRAAVFGRDVEVMRQQDLEHLELIAGRVMPQLA